MRVRVARAVCTRRAWRRRRRQTRVPAGAHLEVQVAAAAAASRDGGSDGGNRASHVPGADGGQRRAIADSRFQRLYLRIVRCPTGVRRVVSIILYTFLPTVLSYNIINIPNKQS